MVLMEPSRLVKYFSIKGILMIIFRPLGLKIIITNSFNKNKILSNFGVPKIATR